MDVLSDPRKRKDEISEIEKWQLSEVNELLQKLQIHEFRNKEAQERYSVVFERHLDSAFDHLLALSRYAIMHVDHWVEMDTTLHRRLQSLQHDFQEISKVAKAGFKEISDESVEACYEEESITTLTRRYIDDMKSLQSELQDVERFREIYWRDFESAQAQFISAENHAAQQEARIRDLNWFEEMFSDVSEMRRQLNILQKGKAEQEASRNAAGWKHTYMRELVEREREVLASSQSRVKILEDTLERIKIDENKLIDIKNGVAEVYRHVSLLEASISSDRVMFGRLDFLKCVLQLLWSDDMALVEKSCIHVHNSKEGIIYMCKERLSIGEWEEAQRPYTYLIDEM